MISRKVGYLKYAHSYGPHPGEPLDNRRRFWRKSLDIALRDMKEATAAQDKRRVRLASKHCQEAKEALAHIEAEGAEMLAEEVYCEDEARRDYAERAAWS